MLIVRPFSSSTTAQSTTFTSTTHTPTHTRLIYLLEKFIWALEHRKGSMAIITSNYLNLYYLRKNTNLAELSKPKAKRIFRLCLLDRTNSAIEVIGDFTNLIEFSKDSISNVIRHRNLQLKSLHQPGFPVSLGPCASPIAQSLREDCGCCG